jgi:IclR family transcriptional regulator, pca regulon regulatory protein
MASVHGVEGRRLRSTAAPFREPEGTVVAAVQLSVGAGRTSLRRLVEDLPPSLLATDLRTSCGLGRTASA